MKLTILCALFLFSSSALARECKERIFTGTVKLFTPNTAYLYVENDEPKVLIWKKGGFPAEVSQQVWLGHFYLKRKKLDGSRVWVCGALEDRNLLRIDGIEINGLNL